MINIQKNSRVILQAFRLNLLQILEYRINFIFDTGVRFIEFAAFFFFWKAIFSANGTIPGWDLTALIVLYAFQQMFLSLFIMFAHGAYRIEKVVTRGGIDKYLSRPVAPWLMILAENSFFSVGGWITGIGALLIAQLSLGAQVFTPLFPIMAGMVILAALISTFTGLTIGCLSFWFGRTRIFNYLTEGFWEFDSYPMTLFPGVVQTLSSFVLPFLFATTTPALAITGTLAPSELVRYFVLEILVFILILGVFSIAWREGVRRYESSGG